MSEPRIYSGAEALALREAAEHPIAPTHTHALTLTTGETALLHAAPDLAASVAHHETRGAAIRADRDAALAHAEELTAALRVARSDLERLRADGRVELRERAERAEEALATERTARARAEAAMDERGLRLVAVVRERDALRAIVAGRREPPTAEDVRAIISVNGCFRYGYDDGEPGGTVTTYAGVTDVLRICDDGVEVWWWAQDALGTPCAWPTAEAPRG